MTEERIDNFSLHKIARSGQCFRMTPMESDSYQLVAHGRRLVVSQDGPAVRFDCSREEFDGLWRHYFDLDADYSHLTGRADPRDRFLQEALRYGQGLRILRQDPWETMISFIISQRKNIPAIAAAVEAMCRRFGDRKADKYGEFYDFPTAARIAGLDIGDLLECSLGYRAKYVLSAAKRVAQGKTDLISLESLSSEDLYQSLLEVDGIGAKVANCVMLFAYHRVDAFPIDVWIERMINTEYEGRFPCERYQGCAGILQQYIFFYARSETYKNCPKPLNQHS